MAPFNPTVSPVSINDPSWLRSSKDIAAVPAPPAITSSEEATGRTIGQFAKIGAEAASNADAYMKSVITEKVYGGVDAEREPYTNALEKALGNKGGQTDVQSPPQQDFVGPPTAPAMNILPDGQAEAMPASLQNLGSKLDVLNQAKIAKPDLETYYIGSLNALAKNLRNQYPGYRDYIDSQISQVTGMNPANAYYNNLVTILAKQSEAANSDRNKTETFIRSNMQWPGMPKLYEDFKAGKATEADVYQKISPWLQFENNLTLQQKIGANKAQDRNFAQQDSKDKATNVGNQYVANSFNTIMDGSELTPAKINSMLTDAELNKNPVTDEQAKAWAYALSAHKAKAIAYMDSQYDKLRPDGTSITTDMGGNTVKQEVLNGIAQKYDSVIDRINKKDVGMAYHNSSMATSIIDDASFKMLNGKDPFQEWLKNSAVVSKLGANNAAATAFFNVALSAGMPKKAVNFFNAQAAEIAADEERRKSGDSPTAQTPTLQDQVTAAKKAGFDIKTMPRMYDGYVTMAERMGNPDVSESERKGWARAVFSPGNSDFLKNFAKDEYDRIKGQWVPGYYSVFQRFTSPDITKNTAALGPEYRDQMANTSLHWAGQLFRTDIENLKSIQEGGHYKFTWDSKNYKLTPVNADDRDFTDSQKRDQNLINVTAANMNRMFGGLRNVAEATGIDVNRFILEELGRRGVNLSQGLNGVPENILGAVLSSQPKKTSDSGAKKPERSLADTYSGPGLFPVPVGDNIERRRPAFSGLLGGQ